MRPRTLFLLMLAGLALGWYVAEPTTGNGSALVRTGVLDGGPNFVALALLAVVLIVMVWPWLARFKDGDDEK